MRARRRTLGSILANILKFLLLVVLCCAATVSARGYCRNTGDIEVSHVVPPEFYPMTPVVNFTIYGCGLNYVDYLRIDKSSLTIVNRTAILINVNMVHQLTIRDTTALDLILFTIADPFLPRRTLIFPRLITAIVPRFTGFFPQYLPTNPSLAYGFATFTYVIPDRTYSFLLCNTDFRTDISEATTTWLRFTYRGVNTTVHSCNVTLLEHTLDGIVSIIGTDEFTSPKMLAPAATLVTLVQPTLLFERVLTSLNIFGQGLTDVIKITVGEFPCSIVTRDDALVTCQVTFCPRDQVPVCVFGTRDVTLLMPGNFRVLTAVTVFSTTWQSPFGPTAFNPALDEPTRLYMAEAAYTASYPPHVEAPGLPFMPTVLQHTHPHRAPPAWLDYLYRVDFVPGTFAPRIPFEVYWGDLRLLLMQLDSLGFAVIIPRCEYPTSAGVPQPQTHGYSYSYNYNDIHGNGHSHRDGDGDSDGDSDGDGVPPPQQQQQQQQRVSENGLYCPGGQIATLRVQATGGLPLPAWLPAAASSGHIVCVTSSETTTELYPALLHQVIPRTLECGDAIDLQLRIHGVLPARVETAILASDLAAQALRRALLRRGVNDVPPRTPRNTTAGGYDGEVDYEEHEDDVLPRIAIVQAVAMLTALADKHKLEVHTNSSLSLNQAPLTAAHVARLATLLPALFPGQLGTTAAALAFMHDDVTAHANGETASISGRMNAAAVSALSTRVAAVRAALGEPLGLMRAPINALPHTMFRFSLMVADTSDSAHCLPGAYDAFVVDEAGAAVETLYDAAARRVQVRHNPFPGAQFALVWLWPLPSSVAARAALGEEVVQLLRQVMGLANDTTRVVVQRIDAEANIIHVGLLPSHRRAQPTTSILVALIAEMVEDETSLLRRTFPAIDPSLHVTVPELWRCPPRSEPDTSLVYEYKIDCSPPDEPAQGYRPLVWLAAAAGAMLAVLLLSVIVYCCGCSCCRCCGLRATCGRVCCCGGRWRAAGDGAGDDSVGAGARWFSCCCRADKPPQEEFYYYGLQ